MYYLFVLVESNRYLDQINQTFDHFKEDLKKCHIVISIISGRSLLKIYSNCLGRVMI